VSPAASDGVPLVAAEEACADAGDLLDKLAPHHSSWSDEPTNWIFRGQPDDSPLLAKAHRDPRFFSTFGVDLTPAGDESVRRARDRVESGLIAAFVRELREAGTQLPPAPAGMPGFVLESDFLDHPDAHRALAQHYGIPTSLLDWTTRSMVAAYFAAAEAAKTPDGERLVVWALRRDALNGRMSGFDLRVVDPPLWANPNQLAQAGTFTHFTEDEITPLDEYLPRVAAVHTYVTVPRPWMRKLTAPRSCAPKLLRMLAAQGITGAKMFPGHEGVVRAIRERALWDIP
jgi:hypothetical protein